MLQNKRFHLGGCMHEYSVELYDNFVVKLIEIFVFHWHFVDFLMTFNQ